MTIFEEAQAAIAHARTKEEVHSLLRACIARIDPVTVRALPMGCQLLLEEPIDIPGAALELRRYELRYTGSPEAGVLLREIAQTFVAAASRLANIEDRS
jgi:hypothetical protein